MVIAGKLASLLAINADLAYGISIAGRMDVESRDTNGIWSPQPAGNDTFEAGGTYCRFYSDSKCNNQVGKVSYNVHNTGCFRNSGRYMHCPLGLDDAANWALIQSPNNDGNCNCQVACHHWDQNLDTDECLDLVKYFRTTHYWTWRFIGAEIMPKK